MRRAAIPARGCCLECANWNSPLKSLWRTLQRTRSSSDGRPRSPSQSHSAGTAGHFMRLLSSHRCKEQNMDREHVKGAADKVKGAIKDTAGKVTGDKKLQSEGKFDKAKGSAHNLAGDVKDAARDASKTADD